MRLSDIIISKQNARTVMDDDEEDLKDLSKSIKSSRLINRIILRAVEEEKFEVIAGQRRLKALRIAYGEEYELSDEDYIILNVSDDEAYMISLYENINRREFSPMDLNRAYLKLNHDGKTDKEIAHILGVTPYRLKRLANLSSDSNKMPEPVKDELSKPPSESKFNDKHWEKIREVEDEDIMKDVVDFIMEHETPAKDVPQILKSVEKNFKKDNPLPVNHDGSVDEDSPPAEPIKYSHKGELILEKHGDEEILKVIGKGEDEEVPINQYLNYLRDPEQFKCFVTFKLKIKPIE
jgi:ParB family transcriptional regulator, chromosome partitioning protein